MSYILRGLKTTWSGSECADSQIQKFSRFAKKQHLDDATLCAMVREMEAGIIHADLGGGVFKQRVARKGQGKSGGYRVIVLYKLGKLVLLVHGLSKSEEDNITPAQEEKFRDMSRIYLGLSEKLLNKLVANKEFTEVKGYEKET